MVQRIDIIKQQGKRPTEAFSREKLHASIQAACLSVRSAEGEANITANAVCDFVDDWLKTRPEVTSHDIRRVATRKLRTYDPEAAYLYAQHRTII